MKPLINLIILLSSSLSIFLAVPADAGIPRLFEVKDEIVEPQRTELKTRKVQLLLQRDALNASVDAYNSRCRNITEELAIVYECKKNYTLLEINISIYAISVHKFNRAVLNAPRTAPAPSPEPAPRITKKSKPAPRITKAPEPAPRITKAPKPAPGITNINEYLMIAKGKTVDVHKDNSTALDEMVKTAEAYAANTAKKQRFKKVQREIYKRRTSSLKQIKKYALRHMSDNMEQLKQEGYYRDGDDLMEKERSDPRFREAVQKVLELQYEAELDVHKRALKEMRSALEELRNE